MNCDIGISLVKAVVREAAKMLVLAWLSNMIEEYNAKPQSTSLYFSSDDFGQVFRTIGWSETAKIKVSIELEDKGIE